MRSLLALASLCSSLFAAPVPKELRKGVTFEGTWKLERTVVDGRKIVDPGYDFFWKIDANHVRTLHTQENEAPAIRVANPQIPGAWAVKSVGPKATQLHFDTNRNELDFGTGDLTRLGIYTLEGDTLTICLSFPGSPRPVSVKEAEKTQIWTLKRVDR